MAKLLNLDDSVLMEITSLDCDGNDIIIKGTILGSMPVTSKLNPANGRALLKMLSLKMVLFLATFLFRSSKS